VCRVTKWKRRRLLSLSKEAFEAYNLASNFHVFSAAESSPYRQLAWFTFARNVGSELCRVFCCSCSCRPRSTRVSSWSIATSSLRLTLLRRSCCSCRPKRTCASSWSSSPCKPSGSCCGWIVIERGRPSDLRCVC